jgi:transcriptional regulator with XRE-family HTH domain
MGKRLKARARSLKMTDADVARRVGVSQPRYANYVSDTNEPDLNTFVRICKALSTTPDEVLGVVEIASQSESDLLNARVSAATAFMDLSRLRIAAALLDTLAKMPDGEAEISDVKADQEG